MTRSRQIIWDAYGLHNPYSGVASHARQLFGGFPSHTRVRLITDKYLPHFSQLEQIPWGGDFTWTRRIKPLWNHRLRRHLKRSLGEPALVHGLSNFNIYKASPKDRCILTVHDLIPLLAPKLVSKTLALQFRYLLPRAIEMADRVICVSHWTYGTCLEYFPKSKNKFVYIPNGQDECYQAKVSRETQIKNVCFIARYEKYKGFELLCRIMEKSPESWHFSLVTDQAGALFIKNQLPESYSHRIDIHCGISRDKLENVLKSSSVLIHTSLYEGFCLPAADAIAHGIPVVYMKGSGIDEVVGSGGIGLDRSEGAQSWIDAIASYQSLWQKDMENLKNKMKEAQLQFLSWRQVAEKTVKIYNELMN